MKKLFSILLSMLCFFAAHAQFGNSQSKANTFIVVDSIRIGGVWYSSLDGLCSGTALADLEDVNLAALRNHDALIYDSTNAVWVNVRLDSLLSYATGTADTIVIHTLSVDSIFITKTLRIPKRDTSTYAHPTSALITFQTSDNKFYGYNGTAWICMSCGSSGGTAANVGSGFRILKPATQELKTLFAAYPLLIDSSTNTNGLTIKPDTGRTATSFATGGALAKVKDSLAALISGNTNYFDRLLGTSGTQSVIYPHYNINDHFSLGYAGDAGMSFYNAGSSRLDGAIGFGGSGVPGAGTMQGSTTTATDGYIGIYMNYGSSATGASNNISIEGGVSQSSSSASASGEWTGVYGYGQGAAATGNPGTINGVWGDASTVSATSASIQYMNGVKARIILGSANAAGAIPKNANAFHSYGILNQSAAADSVRYYHVFIADSVPTNLVSSAKVWGTFFPYNNFYHWQNGLNKFGGPDSVATTAVDITGGLKLRPYVTSAGTETMTVNSASNWVFTGTTATWTAPTIANANGWICFVKNRGSGNLTINSNAGGNDFYDASAVNTKVIPAGSAVILCGDGTFINIE